VGHCGGLLRNANNGGTEEMEIEKFGQKKSDGRKREEFEEKNEELEEENMKIDGGEVIWRWRMWVEI